VVDLFALPVKFTVIPEKLTPPDVIFPLIFAVEGGPVIVTARPDEKLDMIKWFVLQRACAVIV
jgi:NhaP-type Na+/H+ or K+/H+ antiporter